MKIKGKEVKVGTKLVVDRELEVDESGGREYVVVESMADLAGQVVTVSKITKMDGKNRITIKEIEGEIWPVWNEDMFEEVVEYEVGDYVRHGDDKAKIVYVHNRMDSYDDLYIIEFKSMWGKIILDSVGPQEISPLLVSRAIQVGMIIESKVSTQRYEVSAVGLSDKKGKFLFVRNLDSGEFLTLNEDHINKRMIIID